MYCSVTHTHHTTTDGEYEWVEVDKEHALSLVIFNQQYVLCQFSPGLASIQCMCITIEHQWIHIHVSK